MIARRLLLMGKKEKPAKGIISDFKDFIFKGNVLDLAIGVIIGGAFSKIVSSLVADIIMPLISVISGSIDLSGLKLVITTNTEPIIVTYGNFLQNIVDFLLTALCIFVAIRLVNSFRKKKEEEKVETILTKDQELLQEIRDLLKEKKK